MNEEKPGGTPRQGKPSEKSQLKRLITGRPCRTDQTLRLRRSSDLVLDRYCLWRNLTQRFWKCRSRKERFGQKEQRVAQTSTPLFVPSSGLHILSAPSRFIYGVAVLVSLSPCQHLQLSIGIPLFYPLLGDRSTRVSTINVHNNYRLLYAFYHYFSHEYVNKFVYNYSTQSSCNSNTL